MGRKIRSDCGKVKELNEDDYLRLERSDFSLFAVADGMGGHNAGEIASSMAIDILKDYEFDLDNMPGSIIAAIKFANKQILTKARENIEYEGMGTTLTTAVLIDDKLYIGHIGDSRAYLLRNSELRQLTEDHSLVNKLVKAKEITSQEAREHPQSNILLQALGVEKNIDIDIVEVDIKEGDIVLLCTDGLNRMVKDDTIEEVLLENSDLEEKAKKLVQIANEFGGYDNVTVNIFTA